MSESSVPGVVFGPNGLELPKESDILNGVLDDMNAAFGGNLNRALSTPQGQLATSQAALIAASNDLFAKFISGIDPATADGVMQDAIGRLYFIDRIPATPTSVQVLCTGLAGVVIPQGSVVVDGSGNQYASTVDAIIPASGSITIQFAALIPGPTPCPASAITTIYRAIAGWDSVTNIAAGLPGANVESRADFEYRRQQSVALNAAGSLPSIYAAVFDVDGVSDVYVTENSTSAAVTVGGVSLAPNSIYVAAVGGAQLDIATAIWRKKSVGANYNGNTTVTVTDSSGYARPYPSYLVKYQTPSARPILFSVQIANSPSLPADIKARVKAAIVSAFTGGDGGTRARIGSTIYASRFYAPVSAVDPNLIEIVSLQIGTIIANQNSVTVGIDQAPTVSQDNITVTLV